MTRAWNARGVLASSRRQWLAIAFVAILTALYSTLAIRLHLTFHTAGYDLGIFEQAIRAYSHLLPPIVDLKGPGYDLLGDHFHPILVLLAPVYALVPSPLTLLVAQAFLFALGAAPLVTWARRSLGLVEAIAVGISYGLSFGLAAAVVYDFHEIAFAVPLIAFSLSSLGRGSFTAAVGWALPLVLVKEDLGLTVVAVIGLLVFIAGRRRLGILLAAIGVLASVVEVTVLLPAFNTAGSYGYWNRLSSGPSVLTVATTSIGRKVVTVLTTFGITAFSAVASPIALVAIPTLAWRFLSNDPNYWGVSYHYSAVLMPIVVAAAIDSLARWRRLHPRTARRGVPVLLAITVAITLALLPANGFARLFQASLWQPNPRAEAIRGALVRIPDGVTVSASDNLAAQLTARDTVSLFGLHPLSTVAPEWIVVDPESPRHYRVTREDEQKDLAEAQEHGYRIVYSQNEITLLRAG